MKISDRSYVLTVLAFVVASSVVGFFIGITFGAKSKSLPAFAKTSVHQSSGGCPFGFTSEGRALYSAPSTLGRREKLSSSAFLDSVALSAKSCSQGFCVPKPADQYTGGYFYINDEVCEDKLPLPLVRVNATQAAAACFDLAVQDKCVGADFLNGKYCALSCGICTQPIYVSASIGSYSGINQLLPSGLFNSSRFLSKMPRKLDCVEYDPLDVVADIKAWAATKPANLDLAKLVRAGFHDAASFNKWTGTGGPSGRIIYGRDQFYGQNHGLIPIVRTSLSQFKAKYKEVLSWADLLQIAAMTAVDIAGGPRFQDFGFEPGRLDSVDLDSIDGLLPNAGDEATIASVRDYWYRAGFADLEAVASMGGHTLGSSDSHNLSFTANPDRFDNEYYQNILKYETDNPPCCQSTKFGGFIQLSTDRALLTSPTTRGLVQLYASNQTAFFEDYTRAIQKMSLFGQDTSVQWCQYSAATEGGQMRKNPPVRTAQ